ncbi:unnamed protein product [Acanthoscelides obtectus]|uniref:Uncharacterized protein n=1 Tax=Acanthoscelides obtectus TaxID=200917 RepID=A0A9P0KJH3_ACAOB|nr:unnamed protein product [Acanthoscelides obtectus]CAK1681704.1 O-acetyl-ADP-ribose deacetylase 1 [Acanthoscelides obtectus]
MVGHRPKRQLHSLWRCKQMLQLFFKEYHPKSKRSHFYHTQLKNWFQKSEYPLAHCVAEDLQVSIGIAKVFLRKLGGMQELRRSNPEVGEVLQITEDSISRKILYLVTKKASYQKPNYEDVWSALC